MTSSDLQKFHETGLTSYVDPLFEGLSSTAFLNQTVGLAARLKFAFIAAIRETSTLCRKNRQARGALDALYIWYYQMSATMSSGFKI
jgi:hypothetical protein